MDLFDLGYNKELENAYQGIDASAFEVGRVVAEYRELYLVRTRQGEFKAEITGSLRYAAQSQEDFPSVGDWVLVTTYEPDFALIHRILPRFSVIKRQAVGQYGEVQIIATNIDYAFILQAIDRDYNLNRLERYLTICYSSKVMPIIVLTKIDLIEADCVPRLIENLKVRIGQVPVLAISNATRQGYEAIDRFIEKGKTYCLLGSSGVGKSTLLNNLAGKQLMKTDTISQHTLKGRHVTTHRQLIMLGNGGLLIDTPGMREIGLADTDNGLEMTFDQILALGQNCKYRDCTHTHEAGCAVLAAIADGAIDRAAYENYLKLERERTHFETTLAERRKREKSFSKMVKNYQKTQRKDRL
jgi:ribosome biogenesis GTPase